MIRKGFALRDKGGSFATHPAKLTPRSCVAYPPWQRVFDVGFRVVTEE
ncbi:MAG: hypothetical protein FWG50_11595 [Kiritimatiellaeota bacterium]|nr:hypothetical protein [Kiritimatiellota bacterium]